jgi:hypothetical protein
VRLWVISDLHMESHRTFDPKRPEFDVLVCAGDVYNDIVVAIGMVRAIAGNKLAIFVPGNHEWWGDLTLQETIERGHAAADRAGICFLECDSYDIGDVRFSGATLWTQDDPRFHASMQYLQSARADVVVTHFEPPPAALVSVGARLWIHGHHHGHEDLQTGRTRLIRNAGYPGEAVPDGEPVREDFVVEI